MDKEEARRQINAERSNHCAAFDHHRFDHRDFIAVNCFVKTLHGRG
jgi:hypothetical protein